MRFMDDRFHRHPKVVEAGTAAGHLLERAIAYSCEFRTGGFISDAQLAVAMGPALEDFTIPYVTATGRHRRRRPKLPELRDKLLEVGAFERSGIPNVYGIHDFHDWQRAQPTVDELEAQRAEKNARLAEAGRRGAAVRWARQRQAEGYGQAMARPSGGHAEANGQAIPPQTPPDLQIHNQIQKKSPPYPPMAIDSQANGQAIAEAIAHGHPEATPEGEGDSSFARENPEMESGIWLRGAIAHGHPEATPEFASEPASEPPKTQASQTPEDALDDAIAQAETDAEVIRLAGRHHLRNQAWTWNERLPSNREGLAAITGYFDGASFQERASRNASLANAVLAFLGEQQRASRPLGLDPAGMKTWLDRNADFRPKGRPKARPGPVKASGMPPPGELVPAEELQAFANAFGGSA